MNTLIRVLSNSVHVSLVRAWINVFFLTNQLQLCNIVTCTIIRCLNTFDTSNYSLPTGILVWECPNSLDFILPGISPNPMSVPKLKSYQTTSGNKLYNI